MHWLTVACVVACALAWDARLLAKAVGQGVPCPRGEGMVGSDPGVSGESLWPVLAGVGPGLFGVVHALPKRTRRRATRLEKPAAEQLSDAPWPSSVVSDSPVAILALNTRRQVIFWNPAAEKLLGHSASEALGRPVRVSATDGCDVSAILAERVLVQGQRFCEVMFHLAAGDPPAPVLACASPLHGSSGEVSGVVMTLVSWPISQSTGPVGDDAYIQMLHGSRLNTLGRMASGLAHEINQPLCAIGMAIEGGLRMMCSGQDIAKMPLYEALRIASMEAQRAREILRRFRNFARKRKSRKTRVRIERLIPQSLDLARVDPRFQQVTVDWKAPGHLPAVRADSVQIQQVLLNLLRNAMDAMEHHATAERVLIIDARPTNGAMVEVRVADTGRAVPSDEVALLFEPFFTTKPDGMGMGLAVSRMIIDEHGGYLCGQANDQGGMTFRFTLPLAQENDDDASA